MDPRTNARRWLQENRVLIPDAVWRCIEALPDDSMSFVTKRAYSRVHGVPVCEWELTITTAPGAMQIVDDKWARSSCWTALYDALATWLDITTLWPDSGVDRPEFSLLSDRCFTFSNVVRA